MLAYNSVHWEWCHLGLFDLLDAVTTDSLPEYLRSRLREMRPEPGEITRFYAGRTSSSPCAYEMG
jgi:hypothetical protein